jgi:hypothetical protein
MINITEKSLRNSAAFCKLTICFAIIGFIFIVLWIPDRVPAQTKTDWQDILMTDTNAYAIFSVDAVSNAHYPPSNLFDANFNTCWVSGSDKNRKNTSLFIRLPKQESIRLNIFSGYGKNKKLYKQNARPKELCLSVFAAFNPQGYSTEKKTLYKMVEFPRKLFIKLSDHFGVQSFPLNFFKKNLETFKKEMLQCYKKSFSQPMADSGLILKINILSFYPGTKYRDVCISEIFFNDCFVPRKKNTADHISKIYTNKNENALLLDKPRHKGIVAFKDTSAVLQVLEVSKDRKWAVLASMPADIHGRAETLYLLIDLVNRKMVNPQIAQYTGIDISATPLYFEVDQFDRTYLMIDEKYKIRLR